MNLKELCTILDEERAACPRFILPDGDQIPAHFHVTEVGYVTRKFIDCGGVTGQTETCLLQTWLGDDLDHRLDAGTLGRILRLGDRVLPPRDLEVEIEYDCCVVAQYPIAQVVRSGAYLDFTLENKRTQCLARERGEARAEPTCCAETSSCC